MRELSTLIRMFDNFAERAVHLPDIAQNIQKMNVRYLRVKRVN